uniref:Retrovirus-related Pol polyprotein from transposon TNT 1-94 n=1 Tax=Noccaea caerulescens TaxID=107243 RepID=A0A1J3HB84_NOCCA
MTTTASAASADTVALSESTSLIHVNMTNVTKLTTTNFLMWSRQVHALFDGYDLAGYLDGSLAIPPSTITTDAVVSVNPSYTAWKRQDKLVFSALLGAITTSVQPLLSTATTAAAVWSTLSATYAKPSRGHFKQLKQQIKQWTKGTKSITEYYQGLTTRFDQLALLGKAMDLEDQIEFLLEGLPEEYKTVVDQIEGRDSPPSLTEIHEKLINHEAKLQSAVVVSPTPVSVNAAQYRGSNNNNYRGQNRNTNNRGNWSHSPQPISDAQKLLAVCIRHSRLPHKPPPHRSAQQRLTIPEALSTIPKLLKASHLWLLVFPVAPPLHQAQIG